jgi:pSer/pThr/pTyr-binding forkhead associated (FHA) protein
MASELSFKLVIVDDEGKTTPVPLSRDDYTIGRQEGNVIRLTERNVSRQHARLFRHKGHWIIEDLDSYNGVVVNSERVKERAVVKSGDTIQIGDYRLIFREVAEAESEESVIVDGDIPSMPPPPRLTTAVEGEQPKLILINGPDPGSVVNLEDGETVIGRGEGCDLQIEDVSVSREHARVNLSSDSCMIEDLGSSNGIRINGMSRTEHYLQHGDTIELGNILIRFVAAGAWDPLLEQLQMQSGMPETAASRRALTIGLPLAIVGLLVVVGLAVLLITRGSSDEKSADQVVDPGELKTLSIDELIHRTKASFNDEKWRETVTYAAEVLKYEPSNKQVRQMKEQATYEIDQEPYYEEGIKAYERKEWKRAYYTFSKIGVESVYRSKPEVEAATSKYIEQLMNELYDAHEDRDLAKVEEKQLVLESLPEATEEHKREAKRLVRDLRPPKKGSGGGASPKKRTLPAPTVVKKGSASTPSAPTTSTHDALKEARKAILADDQKKCIAILQKTKTTPTVLDLLATCYKGAKQMDRYYATLKRYVSKYPTGPKADKYKKILEDAGQL